MNTLRTASGRQLRGQALIETPQPFTFDASATPGARVLGEDGQIYESMKDWVTGLYTWKVRAQGEPGPRVELQKSPTHLQWRVEGSTGPWTNLVPLSDLVGPQGAQGADGAQGPQGAGLSYRGSVATVADLPSQSVQGYAYLVAATNDLWIYSGSVWNNAGPIQGPAGPAGPTGATGPAGATGAAGADGADGAAVQLQKTSTEIQWRLVGDPTWQTLVLLSDIKGPVGDVGPAGPAGPGFSYQGSVATVALLPSPSTQGFAFLVVENGNLYIYNGTAWVNAGPLQGPVGPAGPSGQTGATGSTGPAGPGLPTGGTIGQLIRKSASGDYVTEWFTPSATDISGLGTLATQNGTFSGSSSGTNTGDQTITLTGDVTGSGTGSFATTLANTTVTAGSYGSASQVATFTVDAQGRLTAASNTSISIASTGISDSTAAGRALLTGADASAQRTSLGLGTAATSASTAFAASGLATASGLTMATARLLGRSTASTGAVEEISVGTGLSLSGSTLSATASGGGTKTIQRFSPRDNQPPASNFATLNTRNSIAVLEFDAATQESSTFVGVISEGANLASGLMVRLWWMGATATSGNVRWAASFERSGTNLDSDSFDTATEITSAANGTSGIETVAAITCTAIDSLAAGERFRLRIARKAADATNDTMTGDAQLVAVEVRGVA